MREVGEVQYLVLPDSADPYLLARVRWPDVAQAISAGCPDWLEDVGLFDLPTDPSSTPVTLAQATAIAAKWGAQIPSDATVRGVGPALIRRMPANWSNLTPAEKRAWSLESVIAKRRVRLGGARTRGDTENTTSRPGRRRSPVHVNGRAPGPSIAVPETSTAESHVEVSAHDDPREPVIGSPPTVVIPETADGVVVSDPSLPAVFSRMRPRSNSPRPSRIPRAPRPSPAVPGTLGREGTSPSQVNPDVPDAATGHSDNGVDVDLGVPSTNGHGGRPSESKV